MPATVEEYMQLPYHLVLRHDEGEDGIRGYFAEVQELPGCWSQGANPEEATSHLQDAMRSWLEVAIGDGVEIPLPIEELDYSGRFVVRLPKSLHAQLARTADREGVSLNQLVTAVLAGAVQWRSDDLEVARPHRRYSYS